MRVCVLLFSSGSLVKFCFFFGGGGETKNEKKEPDVDSCLSVFTETLVFLQLHGVIPQQI